MAAVLLPCLVGWSPAARADGSFELPLSTRRGCLGLASYGVGMYETGSGEVTIDPPGPILSAVIHWVGSEDETPSTTGTSTLSINGTSVVGVRSPGPAGYTAHPTWTWYSWWADIGPTGLDLVNDAARRAVISGWRGSAPELETNGATIAVVYDTSPCSVETEVSLHVGVDWYYFPERGEPVSELIVQEFPVSPDVRTLTVHLSHAGTDSEQTSCRGGAIWLVTGDGPAPDPTGLDIIAIRASGRGAGINGGVEIVNDPFTSPSLPCRLRRNPAPDEPYAPGHPCFSGAASCPYRATAVRPTSGGHVDPEWGVIEVDIRIPAGHTWAALQLESEADQRGESGSWVGASFIIATGPVCGDGIRDPGEECDDGNNEDGDGCSADCRFECDPGPPSVEPRCLDRAACNDPGECFADLPCDHDAVLACGGDPSTVTCDPASPYPVGTTDVVITATGPTGEYVDRCEVVVRDCEPPSCEAPEELTLECDESRGIRAADRRIAEWLNRATASDNCEEVTIDRQAPDIFPADCAPGARTPVTWTAADAAGHEVTCASAVVVQDTAPPAVDCPGPLRLECDGGAVATADDRVVAWLGSATGTDRCGPVAIDHDAPPELALECAPGVGRTVEFTARDICGHAASCTATVSLVDSTAPEVWCPAPLAVECPAGGVISAAEPGVRSWLDSAHASDRCAPPTLTNDAPPAFRTACAPGGTTVVTFTATDDCRQTATCTSSVTLQDRTGPEIHCPSPLELACPPSAGLRASDPPIASWLSSAFATDDCGAPAVTHDAPADFRSGCAPGGTTVVTFTATDACHRTATCKSSVTLQDRTGPEIHCPPPIELDCPSPDGVWAIDPRIASWLSSVVASDDCGLPDVTHDAPESFAPGCAPGAPTTVTFRATDRCGLTASCRSTVTVRDVTAPEIACPPPLELGCDTGGGISTADPRIEAWLGGVVAADGCGPVRVIHGLPERLPAGCADGAATPVVFTAVDACGNLGTCASSIRVSDTSPPIVDCPDPLTIDCTEPGGVSVTDPRIAAWLGSAAAGDVCGSVRLTNDRPDFFEAGCGFGIETPVSFTAVDSCGLVASCESTVTTLDSPPEVLDCARIELCISPPNHEYVCFDDISLLATVVEPCGDVSAEVVVICESSQCDDAPCPEHPGEDGDGVTIDDCVYDPLTDRVCVRSERAGSDPRGRYYTISFAAVDSCGMGEPVVGVRFWIPHDHAKVSHCIDADEKGGGKMRLSSREPLVLSGRTRARTRR